MEGALRNTLLSAVKAVPSRGSFIRDLPTSYSKILILVASFAVGRIFLTVFSRVREYRVSKAFIP